MTDYHLRCAAADVPQLLRLAELLGVIVTDAETGERRPAGVGIVWDEIGAIYAPTGQVLLIEGVETPEMAPVLAPDGRPYWHANLRIAGSLAERAEAIGGPEIAAAMSDLPRWFVADVDGHPVAPARPARVFA